MDSNFQSAMIRARTCLLPVIEGTARATQWRPTTNCGLFEPAVTGSPACWRSRRGLTVDEIRAVTEGTLTVVDGLKKIKMMV
jgi:hypothetical protein